jgi:hypothetical protein
MSDLPISLVDWRPLRRNSLCGFATVRIGKSLKVRDVTVHNSNGKRWATFPSKPIIDSAGNVKRTTDGKVQYVPILEWLDRETADKFSAGVIAAVEREFPHALDA